MISALFHTSTLIAVAFGCPGKTERLIIGFFVANQDTGQAEVNHCEDNHQ